MAKRKSTAAKNKARKRTRHEESPTSTDAAEAPTTPEVDKRARVEDVSEEEEAADVSEAEAEPEDEEAQISESDDRGVRMEDLSCGRVAEQGLGRSRLCVFPAAADRRLYR